MNYLERNDSAKLLSETEVLLSIMVLLDWMTAGSIELSQGAII